MNSYSEINHGIVVDLQINKMLNGIIKQKKPIDYVVTNPNLAEKVEPGYLIKLASEIENANNFVFHSACDQLKLIEKQMTVLKKRALQILIETKINCVLNSLPCNFLKKSGHTYSVYQKSDGIYYISMILPEEWGSGCPHKFIGTYKFENSMKWSPVDEKSASEAFRCWVRSDEEEQRMLEGVNII